MLAYRVPIAEVVDKQERRRGVPRGARHPSVPAAALVFGLVQQVLDEFAASVRRT
jgi:hypothetical protein